MFLQNHLRNKGVWSRDCSQQLSWILKYRTGCWGTALWFAWQENVPGTNNRKQTKQKTGTTFHGKLFMNHLLQHSFGIANVHFIYNITLCFLRSETCIFPNEQEIRYCNLLNFFNACNSTGPCNPLIFSNSQENNCHCRAFVHNFFLHWKTATVNRHIPLPHTEAVHISEIICD